MKNYLIILGRGIEGCGNTRNAIELQNYIRDVLKYNCTTIANKDVSIGRKKAQENDMMQLSFKKDLHTIKRLISNANNVLIMSVPPKKLPDDCKVAFMDAIKFAHESGCKLTYMQLDHRINSIARNFYAEPKYYSFFNLIDTVSNYSDDNDFAARFIKKNNIKLNRMVTRDGNYTPFISIDFDKVKNQYWRPVEDKEEKSIRFLGRSAAWKGPYLLRDLHYKHFKNKGYITYIEGIEKSIGTIKDLYTQLKPKRIPDKRNIIVDSDIATYKFERNKSAYVMPPYNREEALERLGKSMFGCELITMVDYIAKDIFENAMFEMVAAGTVPIFRKHWADLYQLGDKKLSEYDSKSIGTIFLDEDKPEEAIALMEELCSNKELYDTYRNNAYKFYKAHYDNSIVLKGSLDRVD